MDVIAIVPVRATRTAKMRLSHVLGPAARERLVARCYQHVVSVLGDAGFDVVSLVAGSLDADGDVRVDRGRGLNAELGRVLEETGTPSIVVPADLPWVTVADIDRVISEPGDVVVARAPDGGTGALVLRSFVEPSFGGRSALRHAGRARARGLRARVLDLEAFADLDDEGALQRALVISPALRETALA